MMTFYETLDRLMRQDFGGRGLLSALAPADLIPLGETLLKARRVILLTGFPVRMSGGSIAGETDGPPGTANLAAALLKTGAQVSVVTDVPSFAPLKAALTFRAPLAGLTCLPEKTADDFIRSFIAEKKPTHFISLERPGKACDGHYHNMHGEQIDDMVTDSALFLSEAKRCGAVTISIGDGGNEMGMGAFIREISTFVPSGSLICSEEAADFPLVSGVSNWWGWGIAAILSCQSGHNLLPSRQEEAELLRLVVDAGAVDGCTKEHTLTVDRLSLDAHLSVLDELSKLTAAAIEIIPAAV